MSHEAMDDNQPPRKRAKFGLTNTFDVVVGKDASSRRFTVYTEVLTKRSDFLRAARDPKWLTDPTKPTDLEDEHPEIFSMYLNCVYFGLEATPYDTESIDKHNETMEGVNEITLPDAFDLPKASDTPEAEEEESESEFQPHFAADISDLVRMYLLADKLQDLETANIVIDEMITYCHMVGLYMGSTLARLVYDSTVHGNPLRKLIRDQFVYESSSRECMNLHVENEEEGYPMELVRDVAVEFLRLKGANLDETIGSVYDVSIKYDKFEKDKCHYHQHDEKVPRCVPKPSQ